jgi:hypothetical protein
MEVGFIGEGGRTGIGASTTTQSDTVVEDESVDVVDDEDEDEDDDEDEEHEGDEKDSEILAMHHASSLST